MGESQKTIPTHIKFLFGGLAGMCGQSIVQPLDVIKNRMQLQGIGGKVREHKTSLHVVLSIVQNEGFLALYNGLTAGLLRQGTYTTARLGVYTMLFERFTVDGKPPNFAVKGAIAMLAGACGAAVCTPAEVALIRMTSDGRLPPDQRRNYKNAIHAIYRIYNEEGLPALWRGLIPTVARAIMVNGVQLATYSQAKEKLIGGGYVNDNIFCHFWASLFSSFLATVSSLPVDIAKTRVQSMKIIDGKPEFRGVIHVITHLISTEGVPALWKGFTPYLVRSAPLTVLIFIFLEQFNAMYYKYVLGTEKRGGI